MDRPTGSARQALRRFLREPALPLLLAALALGLFCFPFVVTPRPTLGEACQDLFVSWAIVIGLLVVLSRSLGDSGPERPPDDSDHV